MVKATLPAPLGDAYLTLESLHSLGRDETLLQSVPGVGLYLRGVKSASHATGTIALTTHRLLFVADDSPSNGVEVALSCIRESEHYAGFLSSSAKVSLTLAKQVQSDIRTAGLIATGQISGSVAAWVCPVCAFSNTDEHKCALCGVAKAANGSSSVAASHSTLQVQAPVSEDNGGICAICTFANHPSLPVCEMCGSALKSGSRCSPSPSPTPRPETSSDKEVIRIAFRQGRDRVFYAALKSALRAKAWDLATSSMSRRKSEVRVGPGESRSATPDGDAPRRPVGIDGIISAVDARARSENQDMNEALRDLAALASQAKRMVDLASSLSAKLARADTEGTASEEASTVISTSLVRLGLRAPALTAADVANEAAYHLGLAVELAELLLATDSRRPMGLMGRGKVRGRGTSAEEVRGIVGLDEVWCVWNRARGVSLVSPAAARAAAALLPSLTTPSISVRELRSGLAVLHTPRWTSASFTARVLSTLEARQGSSSSSDDHAGSFGPGLSAIEVARAEGAPIGLVSELLEGAEMSIDATLVRDEGASGGTRWYPNYFGVTAHAESKHNK